MFTKVETNLGTISIANDVIATIAGVVATESCGIVGMAYKSVKDGIVHLLKRESLSKGIIVTNEEDKVNIELHIIVLYGTNISAISDSVISTVKYQVEEITGIKVNNISVFVEGIKVDK